MGQCNAKKRSKQHTKRHHRCRFGAGGHPKAAAASIRLTSDDPETEARELIEGLVETICKEQVGITAVRWGSDKNNQFIVFLSNCFCIFFVYLDSRGREREESIWQDTV